MKKIFVIEDNDKDFLSIYQMIKKNIENVEIYPSNIDENVKLRRVFKGFFSAREQTSIPAIKKIKELNINSYDGLILDYELFPSNRLVNGIQLFTDLEIKIKTMILTKYTAIKFKKIEEIVLKENLSSLILIKPKGILLHLTDDLEKEHINNINMHFFEIQDDVILKNNVLEKLKENSPLITSASSDINNLKFKIATISNQLTNKINQNQLNLNEEILESLDKSNDIDYLEILNNLNK